MTLSSNWRKSKQALPKGVNLLAVSKGHSSQVIQQLAELGQIDFGESRLQDAVPKIQALSKMKTLSWHFIGPLQSNKVRGVVQNFSFIHSIDSESLAERVARIAGEEKRSIKNFLQVKFLKDPTKGGVNPHDLDHLVPKLLDLPNFNLIGLMTMAPFNCPLNERKNLFQECRRYADHFNLKECSMGMSSDWQEAVEAGTTWLRLGSRLFGKRKD